MGIDIYARWDGITDEEKDAQYRGGFGYLREAYHGEPYATHHFAREAFNGGNGGVPIAASILRKRLPETLRIAEERERRLYGANGEELDAVRQSFTEFVELCERMEERTGKPVLIVASY